MSILKVPTKFIEKYYKQGYRVVGKHQHSAVKICRWTRESLRHNRVCFKEKWYGIESHRCLQCTPALFWCTQTCEFCWRSTSATLGSDMGGFPVDGPFDIIDGLIEAQRMLLMGFKGNEKVDRKRWEEAQNPTNMAISLVGEPTLYERLSDFIEEAHKRGMTTFLVTNGTRPDRLKELRTEPTNLYISLCAPDKETYKKTNRPVIKNGWDKLNESLEFMNNFNCRKVIRLTLVKKLNMKYPEKYAKLILKAEPDFIEPKGFMQIGEAQQRLPRFMMPQHHEIVEFARSLAELLSYKFKNHHLESRVVLLSKK